MVIIPALARGDTCFTPIIYLTWALTLEGVVLPERILFRPLKSVLVGIFEFKKVSQSAEGTYMPQSFKVGTLSVDYWVDLLRAALTTFLMEGSEVIILPLAPEREYNWSVIPYFGFSATIASN